MFDPANPFTPGRSIWCAEHPRPSKVAGAVDDTGDVLLTRAAVFVPVEEAVPLPDVGEMVSTRWGGAWFLGWSETDRADGWMTAYVADPAWSHATQISRPAPNWDARRCILSDATAPVPVELLRLLGSALCARRNAERLLLAARPSVTAHDGPGEPEHVGAASEESR